MFTFLICGRVVSIPLLIYKVVSSFLTDVGWLLNDAFSIDTSQRRWYGGWMNVEQFVVWELDGKTESTRRKWTPVPMFHHKSPMAWLRNEPGPPRWEAGDLTEGIHDLFRAKAITVLLTRQRFLPFTTFPDSSLIIHADSSITSMLGPLILHQVTKVLQRLVTDGAPNLQKRMC
jgi:hypothetical protein